MNTAFAAPHFVKVDQDAKAFSLLRDRVHQTVARLPKSRKRHATLKAFLLPLIYAGIYLLALSCTAYWAFLLLYVFLGIMLVILFLNLIHEACHDNLFKQKDANRIYMLLFDMIGANSYMWKLRHLRLHHNYPNVVDWDSDIEKSSFLKVHPQDRGKLYVRFQHLLVLLYPMFITNWFLVRDFKDFFNGKMIVRRICKPAVSEYCKLFLFKLFFVAYLVAVPVFTSGFSWMQAAGAFFLLLFSAGLFALVVLIPPHVNTSNEFPHADQQMLLSRSWFLHQLYTTNDVNADSWISRHVLGNYNYHIAHHLFPNISYVYAKEVSGVIRQFCTEQNIPFRSYPLLTTFKKHYQLIRRNRQALDLFDEDM